MLSFLVGTSSPFDADVERVTDEKAKSEDWSLIMDLIDKVKAAGPNGCKDCLKSINKRLSHPDPHVVMLSITLLDACVSNCGKPFMLEVASRDFENEFRRLLHKSQPKVQDRLRCLLRKWAEGDFKSDSQLCLIPSLYSALKSEGMDFSSGGGVDGGYASGDARRLLKKADPNAVFSQEEEDDIAKAIELSLKEGKDGGNPKTASSTSTLYPSTLTEGMTAPGGTKEDASKADKLKARALYDFEAAEENELTFKAGEVVVILDHSDANWWKGSNYRGEGLFPSNFVTMDLDDSAGEEKRRRSVQFNEEVEVSNVVEKVEINEEKLDKVLNLLHDADPTSVDEDSPKLINLEKSVNDMGPLIDAELEVVDRKHAELTRLSTELVDALNLYHQLMREAPIHHHQGMYPGVMSNNLPHPMGGFPPPPHQYPLPTHPPMYMQQQQHHPGMHHHPAIGSSYNLPPSGAIPPEQQIPPFGHPQHSSAADMNPSVMGHAPPPPGGNGDAMHFVSSAPPPTPPLSNDPPPQYTPGPNPSQPMLSNGVVLGGAGDAGGAQAPQHPSSMPQYSYMPQYPPQQIM